MTLTNFSQLATKISIIYKNQNYLLEVFRFSTQKCLLKVEQLTATFYELFLKKLPQFLKCSPP